MTLERATEILDDVRWLRLSPRGITANNYDEPACRVQIRRRRGETFAAMMIRAAELVDAGFIPTDRPDDIFAMCVCGASAGRAMRRIKGWNEWLCKECREALKK